MKTNPNLIDGVDIENNTVNKYVNIKFDDHKTLKYVMTNVIHYSIDGLSIQAEEVSKSNSKAHLFYQYPVSLDKRKLTRTFINEQFQGYGKLADVQIKKHPNNNLPVGYAFITFANEKDM